MPSSLRLQSLKRRFSAAEQVRVRLVNEDLLWFSPSDLYFDSLIHFLDRPYSLQHVWSNSYRIDHTHIYSTSTIPDLPRYSLRDPSPTPFYLASAGCIVVRGKH